MLHTKVKDIKDDLLDKILADAFDWVVERYGENSIIKNKVNYLKKYSPLRSICFKHNLKISWSRKARRLAWYYYGQYAEYNATDNTIYIHTSNSHTLEFVLDSLFHEFCHSQQRMTNYVYYSTVLHTPYSENPLEKQAIEFAKENVENFWNFYNKNA